MITTHTTVCYMFIAFMSLFGIVTRGSAADKELYALKLNLKPGPKYADEKREFQGIPSIAAAPGGRLWAAWDGGGKAEGKENYIMVATSGNGGDTWSGLKVVVDPPFRAANAGVWCDPSGRMWLMINLYPNGLHGNNSQMWVSTTDNPDDENPEWSTPRLIAKDLNNFNEPVVLKDGTWLWPSGDWRSIRNARLLSRPLLSSDQGKTFTPGGLLKIPPRVRNYDEYNVVQLRDGRLWLLCRTRVDPYESFSKDGGRTWTPLKPHKTIKHCVSRFFLSRLKSGRLLLVKHGGISQKLKHKGYHGRTHLTAYISDDDGTTWRGGLVLDERRCSYPDGTQTADGTICVIYDHERHTACQVLMARFTEEDILAGKLVSKDSALKRVVNDAGGQDVKPWL